MARGLGSFRAQGGGLGDSLEGPIARSGAFGAHIAVDMDRTGLYLDGMYVCSQ